jgi:hypothetical protein
MRDRLRLRLSFALVLAGVTVLTAPFLALATSPAARFRLKLMRARVADFLTGHGDPEERVAVFQSLALRARARHGGPALDPTSPVRGWSWADEDGLLVETFYDGFEVRWNVYTFEHGELELLDRSGIIYG